MVVLVLRYLDGLHHRKKRRIELTKPVPETRQIQSWIVDLHSPADELYCPRLCVLLGDLLPHVVVKVLVEVVHRLLIVLCKCVRDGCQQVLHVECLVFLAVSGDQLDLVQLLPVTHSH